MQIWSQRAEITFVGDARTAFEQLERKWPFERMLTAECDKLTFYDEPHPKALVIFEHGTIRFPTEVIGHEFNVPMERSRPLIVERKVLLRCGSLSKPSDARPVWSPKTVYAFIQLLQEYGWK